MLTSLLAFYRGTGTDWAWRRGQWFLTPDHNHLRLTRMPKSLQLLRLPDEARVLHRALRSLCAAEADCGVPARSRRLWDDAVGATGATGAPGATGTVGAVGEGAEVPTAVDARGLAADDGGPPPHGNTR